MADKMGPDEVDLPADTAKPGSDEEDDTSGHSMSNYEFVRQEARQRGRETDAWAHKQGLRRESRSLIDRLRRR